jgi:hypothetical protein
MINTPMQEKNGRRDCTYVTLAVTSHLVRGGAIWKAHVWACFVDDLL